MPTEQIPGATEDNIDTTMKSNQTKDIVVDSSNDDDENKKKKAIDDKSIDKTNEEDGLYDSDAQESGDDEDVIISRALDVATKQTLFRAASDAHISHDSATTKAAFTKAGSSLRLAEAKLKMAKLAKQRQLTTKPAAVALKVPHILSKNEVFIEYIAKVCQHKQYVADTSEYCKSPNDKEWIKAPGRMMLVMRTGSAFPVVLIPLASATKEGTTIAIALDSTASMLVEFSTLLYDEVSSLKCVTIQNAALHSDYFLKEGSGRKYQSPYIIPIDPEHVITFVNSTAYPQVMHTKLKSSSKESKPYLLNWLRCAGIHDSVDQNSSHMAISLKPFTVMHSEELSRHIKMGLNDTFGDDDYASDLPDKFKDCFDLPVLASPAAPATTDHHETCKTTTTHEVAATVSTNRPSSPGQLQDLHTKCALQQQELQKVYQELAQAQAKTAAPPAVSFAPAPSFAPALLGAAPAAGLVPRLTAAPAPFATSQALVPSTLTPPQALGAVTNQFNHPMYGTNIQNNPPPAGGGLSTFQNQQWDQLTQKVLGDCLAGRPPTAGELELLKLSKVERTTTVTESSVKGAEYKENKNLVVMLAGYDPNVLLRNGGVWNTILSAVSLDVKCAAINNYWVIPLVQMNPAFTNVLTPYWVRDMAKFKIRVDLMNGFDKNHGLGPKSFLPRTSKELADNAAKIARFHEATVRTTDDIDSCQLAPAALPHSAGDLTLFATRYLALFEHLFGPLGKWTELLRTLILPVAQQLDFHPLPNPNDFVYNRVNPFFFFLTEGAHEMFRHSIPDDAFQQRLVPSTAKMEYIMRGAQHGIGFPLMTLPLTLQKPAQDATPVLTRTEQHNNDYRQRNDHEGRGRGRGGRGRGGRGRGGGRGGNNGTDLLQHVHRAAPTAIKTIVDKINQLPYYKNQNKTMSIRDLRTENGVYTDKDLCDQLGLNYSTDCMKLAIHGICRQQQCLGSSTLTHSTDQPPGFKVEAAVALLNKLYDNKKG